MAELIIDGRKIGDGHPPYLVAELGANHGGSVEVAAEMIRAAAKGGADAVKLQKRDNRTLFTERAFNTPYTGPNSFGATYGEHREALEFGFDEYRELQAVAKEAGVTLFATPFDFRSLHFLEALGMPAYKVASADLTNQRFLRSIAGMQKPMIVSTGGSRWVDVLETYGLLKLYASGGFAIMQCTANYPAGAWDMNLAVIAEYRAKMPEAVIGLSSHWTGSRSEAAMACGLGARIIEKHFTLDHRAKGTDQAFSLDQYQLRQYRYELGEAYDLLGSGIKVALPSEEAAMRKMRKTKGQQVDFDGEISAGPAAGDQTAGVRL